MALASQATGDLIGTASTTQLARIAAMARGQLLISKGTGTIPAWLAAGTSGQYLQSAGAGSDPAWATLTVPTVYETLLIAASGTSTTTTANNLSTVAISGLTSLDQLWVLVWVEQATQDAVSLDVYHVTDSVSLDTTVAITAGSAKSRFSPMMQAKSSTTKVFWRVGANFQSIANTPVSLTTPWGNSWTLGLRSGGMTSGGSMTWAWAVYKKAGQ
jgi:hypothetical protein